MLIIPIGIKVLCKALVDMKRIRVLLLSLVSACVGSCGFQLEGAGTLPAAMSKTYLDTASPNTEFFGSLRSALRLRGSELVATRQDAGAVLSISEDDTGQRVLSVSARNIPREYEIYYSVTIALQAGGEQLMEPESLIVTRNYTYDETQVLGKGEEERVLRRALADDLARRVLRRIESVANRSVAPNI